MQVKASSGRMSNTHNLRKPDHPIDPQFIDRWSPRAFTGEPLTREQMLTLLEAARWAPSASNSQPWRFVYGLKGTAAFETILQGLMPGNQPWAKEAGALLVFVAATQAEAPGQDEPRPLPWHSFDTGSAWMSVALQAQKSGLAAHGMAGFYGDQLRQSLGVPGTHAILAVAAIGHQGDAATLPEPYRAREIPSTRRPLSELACEGRFDLRD